MPWLTVRTGMCCMLLALLSMSTSCRAPWNSEDVTQDDAQTLAALEAQRLGYDTYAMEWESDSENSQWTRFVAAQKPEGPEYPEESLRARLSAEAYWAIHFGPRSNTIHLGPMSNTTAAGGTWLFISRSSGACLGVYVGSG